MPVGLAVTVIAGGLAAAVVAGVLAGSSPTSSTTSLTTSSPASSPVATGSADILVEGPVLAVTSTSITVGEAGMAITAAITGATSISGVREIRTGDEVEAQLARQGSRLVATQIEVLGAAA